WIVPRQEAGTIWTDLAGTAANGRAILAAENIPSHHQAQQIAISLLTALVSRRQIARFWRHPRSPGGIDRRALSLAVRRTSRQHNSHRLPTANGEIHHANPPISSGYARAGLNSSPGPAARPGASATPATWRIPRTTAFVPRPTARGPGPGGPRSAARPPRRP